MKYSNNYARNTFEILEMINYRSTPNMIGYTSFLFKNFKKIDLVKKDIVC
jgi:ATP-dependent exoDNAse (exonuclease V) beta subunit